MKRFWESLRRVAAFALTLAIGILSRDLRAEEDYQITNEVVLVDMRVSPAKEESRAQITFQLENRSTERNSFEGITVADA
jgi:hypothetical protein